MLKKLKQSGAAKKIAVMTLAVVVCLVLVLPGAFRIYIVDDFLSMSTAIFLAAVSFIYLMYSAGHTKDTEEIVPRYIDKIPLDLYLCICVFCAWLIMLFIFSFYSVNLFTLILILAAFAILVIIGTSVCTTIAIRLKLHTLFKNTIIYKIGAFLTRAWLSITARIGYIFQNLPMVFRAIITFATVYILEFIIFLSVIEYEPTLYYFFRVFEQAIAVFLVLAALVSFKKILQAGRQLAKGNNEYQIDTSKMPKFLKEHGENLNNISDGISVAVEHQMKSERFKTELITNVSHDIKTPLTSIINYVDLLKKEEIDNPKVTEYIEVLERQSAKLKKLIEDLVEASKASTGNIAVNAQITDMGVLLTQTVGEYTQRADKAGLMLVLSVPEKEISALVDGSLMWRIFDNLLSNICKYTLTATRVYMDLDQKDSKVIVTFRNISKFPLNITSEELMERFVRGDSSRNTEGSGLGLSIAKSLAELQGGSFDLYVDGDLFKVVMTFAAI